MICHLGMALRMFFFKGYCRVQMQNNNVQQNPTVEGMRSTVSNVVWKFIIEIMSLTLCCTKWSIPTLLTQWAEYNNNPFTQTQPEESKQMEYFIPNHFLLRIQQAWHTICYLSLLQIYIPWGNYLISMDGKWRETNEPV